MNLQQASLPSGVAAVTILGGAEETSSGIIEQVSGHRILLRSAQPLTCGTVVKLRWAGYTVLGQVRGAEQRQGALFYMVKVEHLFRVPEQPLMQQPAMPDETAQALRLMLHGIAENMKLVSPRTRQVQHDLLALQNRVGEARPLEVAESALQLISAYSAEMNALTEMRAQAAASALNVLSLVLEELRTEEPQVQQQFEAVRQNVAHLLLGTA